MVGGIFFVEMPYSDFKHFKGRPVLVFQLIDKNDVLILPLTSNLKRAGIMITNDDIETGSLKKDSVVIVPKITAVDASLIRLENRIATLKEESFAHILRILCSKLQCV